MEPGTSLRRGTVALICGVAAWALLVGSVLLGGMDPAMISWLLSVAALIAAPVGLVFGILGIVRREGVRAWTGLLLCVGWIVIFLGLF